MTSRINEKTYRESIRGGDNQMGKEEGKKPYIRIDQVGGQARSGGGKQWRGSI